MHARFKPQHKWRLGTSSRGRFVEDVLLNHADETDSSLESMLAQAFVVDLSSREMRHWFTPSEWREIEEGMPDLPPEDPALVKSLERFDNVSTACCFIPLCTIKAFLPLVVLPRSSRCQCDSFVALGVTGQPRSARDADV